MVTATASALEGLRLLGRHGGVIEIRLLHTKKGTVSGYFDDLERAAQAITRWDGITTIYATANPVKPALLARAHNRFVEYAHVTTGDADVLRRAWFPVDLDPVRPAGISATDAEVAAAITRRNELVAFLDELDFPAPVLAMSGNGSHALWPIDLANDEPTRVLCERALAALNARFSDEAVHVDETVFNAARIWKVYGTRAMKGDATADRPHRRATLERVPEPLVDLPREALERLAAMAPRPNSTARGNGSRSAVGEQFDLVGAFTARGWYKRALHGGKHAVDCPWASGHSGDSGVTESCLFEPKAVGDPWGFDCRHAHCAYRTIKDVLIVLGLTGRNGRATSRLEEDPPAATEPLEDEPVTSTSSKPPMPDWSRYLYDAADVDAWNFPPVQFLVEGLLPLAGVVWWGGLPKRAKSLFLLYLCLAVHCGRPAVAGHFEITARPRILYVAREDGGSRLKDRIADICRPWGRLPEPGALRFMIRPVIDLMDRPTLDRLVALCLDEDRHVLVLDTWTALSPSADPTAAKDQAVLAAAVIRLAELIQGLVVVVDHSRKNRPNGQPMSSADIHGPYVKWASAEHVVMMDTVAEKPTKRLEIFLEGKDVESDRFFLTVSPRGAGDEKFTYAGSAADLVEARQAVGSGNRAAVLDVLQTASNGLSTMEIVEQLKQTEHPIKKATVIRHVNALLGEEKVKQIGEGKGIRYYALDGPSQVPSETSQGVTQ